MYIGGVFLWQNAVFAARVYRSDIMFRIPSAKPQEPGSRTSGRFAPSLTEHIRPSPFAHVAFAPAR